MRVKPLAWGSTHRTHYFAKTHFGTISISVFEKAKICLPWGYAIDYTFPDLISAQNFAQERFDGHVIEHIKSFLIDEKERS